MNKTRIILAATGGVIALAVLAMATVTWLAFAERAEAFEGGDESEGLEGAVGKVEKLMAKKPYPSEENRKRLEANRQVVEDWCAAVRKDASRGDWCAPSGRTPAQFKEQIATDAKNVFALKNGQRDPVVKPDFTFGPFKDYLADKMPSADQLPKLQRQWFDLMALVDLLATNGVTRITELQVVDRAGELAKAEQADTGSKKKKNAKSKAKSGAKKDKASGDGRKPSVEVYRLSFVAMPAVLVETVRALSFQDRFTVVESFSFQRERDAIADALGGVEKKEAAAAGGRRGRRRAREAVAATEEKKEDEKQQPTVFDPEKDALVKAELTVAVYDFRSLEEEGEGDAK